MNTRHCIARITLLLVVFSGFDGAFAQTGELQSAEELIRFLTPATDEKGASQAVRGIAGVREGQNDTQSANVPVRDSTIQPSVSRAQFRNILFGSNAYNIELESYPQLNEIGKALSVITKADPSATFVVEGHTDATGNAEQNLALSRHRAGAIVNYLVQRFALDSRRIEVVGYGEQRPVASNDTDRDRRLNRRVEIVRR